MLYAAFGAARLWVQTLHGPGRPDQSGRICENARHESAGEPGNVGRPVRPHAGQVCVGPQTKFKAQYHQMVCCLRVKQSVTPFYDMS
jgi:hypothetical protein